MSGKEPPYSRFNSEVVIDLTPGYIGSGDGPPGGGGMEARVAKLESDIGNIKETLSEMKQDVRDLRSDARTDFRLLFGALIAVAVGLAGMMAKGFNWL